MFRVYMFRLFATAVASGLISGFQIYSITVCNILAHVVMPWIQETYKRRTGEVMDKKLLNVYWGIIVGSMLVGAVVGALLVSRISEYLGRRGGLLLCGTLTVIGGFLSGMSKPARSYELLVIGRLFIGVSIGAARGMASMFLTEVAPRNYRGVCGSAAGIGSGVGNLFAVVLSLPGIFGTDKLWPLAFAFQSITSLLCILVILWARESPRHLYLTKRNSEAATESLEFYQGGYNAQASILELQSEMEYYGSHFSSASWGQFLCSRKWLVQNILVFAVNTACVFSGVCAVSGYSSSMLHQLGMPLTRTYHFTVAIGVASGVFSFAVLAVEHLGRRKILISAVLGSILALTCFSAISGASQRKDLSTAVEDLAGVSLIAFFSMYAIQMPVAVFITSELYEQDVRGKGMTLAMTIYWAEAALQTSTFPYSMVTIGAAYSLLPFLIAALLCVVVLFFLLPETKGRRIEDISRTFQNTDLTSLMSFRGEGSHFGTFLSDVEGASSTRNYSDTKILGGKRAPIAT